MKTVILLLFVLVQHVDAFSISRTTTVRSAGHAFVTTAKSSCREHTVRYAQKEEDENPWADPNYPDLEFVNYDDDEYDSGLSDDSVSDDELVEQMREERRLLNDEYQYRTYFDTILHNGTDAMYGEWMVYDVSEDDARPRLRKPESAVTMRSTGQMVGTETVSSYLTHSETRDSPNRDADIAKFETAPLAVDTYWPDRLTSFDFRGQQGIMVCGTAYTICKGVQQQPSGDKEAHVGPFSELYTELGLQADGLRFRIKLMYSVRNDHTDLCLTRLTVCRESLANFPSLVDDAAEQLYGPAGADGGLYDPPPVGEHAPHYMTLDLEGGATILFPYRMTQDNGSLGWVTSLDWSVGNMRYQVDRKVNADLLGLRTLEVSEVQASNADQYRPNDGGTNMRQ